MKRIIGAIPGTKILTCSNLDVSGDYPADAVGGHAPVDGIVDVLSIGGRRKWQEQQCAISEHASDADDIADRGPINRLPLNRRLWTPSG